MRRRARIPRPVVLAGSGLAPAALCVAMPRSRARDVGVGVLNMWAYLAAYEMPNDDPERLAARVRVDYPIAVDRVLGLGTPPTLLLQRAFSAPGAINRFERVLVWCHWVWFTVPHASVAYVMWRTPASAFPLPPPGCTRCLTSARSSTGRFPPLRRGGRRTAGASTTGARSTCAG